MRFAAATVLFVAGLHQPPLTPLLTRIATEASAIAWSHSSWWRRT